MKRAAAAKLASAAIRDLVMTLTFLALIFMAANQNPPHRMVQSDYCPIDYRAASYVPRHIELRTVPATEHDPESKTLEIVEGKWVFGWSRGYGPCSLQDKFFDA